MVAAFIDKLLPYMTVKNKKGYSLRLNKTAHKEAMHPCFTSWMGNAVTFVFLIM